MLSELVDVTDCSTKISSPPTTIIESIQGSEAYDFISKATTSLGDVASSIEPIPTVVSIRTKSFARSVYRKVDVAYYNFVDYMLATKEKVEQGGPEG